MPASGFLGTHAPFSADLNLVLHIAMALALVLGTVLAHVQRFRAHAICQTAVIVLNLPLITFIMLPSFTGQVSPGLSRNLSNPFYSFALVHTALGAVTQVLGLYIVLVAGTRLLPQALCFTNYRPWMRSEILLWWTVVALGVVLYYVWYMSPAAHAQARVHRGTVVIEAFNLAFGPKVVRVARGTTIEWVDTQGIHAVDSDQKLFSSPSLLPNHVFRHTFTHAGTYSYYCRFHGAAGGVGMSARIDVAGVSAGQRTGL